jgi:hypothetical protein
VDGHLRPPYGARVHDDRAAFAELIAASRDVIVHAATVHARARRARAAHRDVLARA